MIQFTDNDALLQNLHRGFSRAARRIWFVCLLAVVALQSYCPSCLVAQSGRIAHDPYAGVDWLDDFRLKTQFHDHVRLLTDRIASYDQAGYDVVSFMHYSGVSRVQGAWTESHWPPEDWLPEDFLASLENIRFFLPNAEQASLQHLLSPFLTDYIEGWHRGLGEKQPHQYDSAQEGIDLIQSLGGLSILAHPASCCSNLTGYHAVEIYNGHVAYEFFEGATATDQNRDMVSFWDARLMEDPTRYAVAVNDWYGPWAADYPYVPAPPAWLIDSGKTIVLSREGTLSSFREAVEAGAMFAVKDVGETKDQFPHIDSILVQGDFIKIYTNDDVTWISNGQAVGTGRAFNASALSPDARYLRAEISNADQSIVYTQPWAIQPAVAPPALQPGDADGDLDFDQMDLIQVLLRAKYLTGHAATWAEGDWSGAPGGTTGSPPAGDGVFDQLDVLSALDAGLYLTGPYGARLSRDFVAADLTAFGSLPGGGRLQHVELTYVPVPEPASDLLLGLGVVVVLACYVRRIARLPRCASCRPGA